MNNGVNNNNGNIVGYDTNTGQPIYQNIPKNNNKPSKVLIIVLIIVGIFFFLIFIGIIVGVFALSSLVSDNTNKLVCKSNEGNVTILYTENGVVGYTAVGIDFDLDSAQSEAYSMGVDNYLEEYKSNFESTTSGKCTYKIKEES